MREAHPHPVQQLFDAATRLPYPAGMTPVPKMISGLSFFPGGFGLYRSAVEQPPFPFGGAMIIGQDFDTEKNYRASDQNGGEKATDPTWRHLLALLRSASVPESSCFYTNAYMGLRTDSSSNTGRSPGRRCIKFRHACGALLVKQIEMMRPKVLVCLGNEVLWFVSQVADVPTTWRSPSWTRIDSADEALRLNLAIAGSDYVVPAAVAMVHPSFRHANVWRRRFRGQTGEAAETALLRAAAACTGLTP